MRRTQGRQGFAVGKGLREGEGEGSETGCCMLGRKGRHGGGQHSTEMRVVEVCHAGASGCTRHPASSGPRSAKEGAGEGAEGVAWGCSVQRASVRPEEQQEEQQEAQEWTEQQGHSRWAGRLQREGLGEVQRVPVCWVCWGSSDRRKDEDVAAGGRKSEGSSDSILSCHIQSSPSSLGSDTDRSSHIQTHHSRIQCCRPHSPRRRTPRCTQRGRTPRQGIQGMRWRKRE